MSEESSRAAPIVPLPSGEWSMDDGASRIPFQVDGTAGSDANRLVVSDPSIDAVNELYEIRITLERLATEIAATQLGDDELAALETIVAQMRDASPRGFVELNREFHSRIYPAAQRPRLSEITESLGQSAASYVRMNIDRYDPAYRNDAQAEHEAILSALRSRAPSWAAHAMHVHLEHSARHVAGLIEKSRRPAPSGD